MKYSTIKNILNNCPICHETWPGQCNLAALFDTVETGFL
jgi:hypothetical protein